MSEPDYRAMWEALRAWAGRIGADRVTGVDVLIEMLARMDEAEKRTFDPDHVPAVRRVVRWEPVHTQWGVTSPPALEAEQVRWAYIRAALALIERADLRAGDRSSQARRYFSHGQGRWVPNERHPRVLKLAAWLRHRDEKAGYR